MKYVVLLLVFVVFYAYWRSQNPRKNLPKDPPSNPQAGKAARPPRSPRPPLELPQPMVACQHCGLHLPISEALSSGQRYYCCAEHQRIDAR